MSEIMKMNQIATMSSREMRLRAGMTLRKRYPSKIKLPKGEIHDKRTRQRN